MSYWDEVKRIQVSMRSASIYTNEASDIIDGITGKYGYLFTIDNIYNAVPIAEIRRMISAAKKRGGTDAALGFIFQRSMTTSETFIYWSGVWNNENVNGSYTVTVARISVPSGSEANPIQLSSGVWANGSITSTASNAATWYSFMRWTAASSGTVKIKEEYKT